MSFDWATFFIGLSAGIAAEAFVGAFVTAPLAIWILRRRAKRILWDILDDKEAMDYIRRKFVNAALGGMFGGRPPSLKNMAKMAAAQVAARGIAGFTARWQGAHAGVEIQPSSAPVLDWRDMMQVPEDKQTE